MCRILLMAGCCALSLTLVSRPGTALDRIGDVQAHAATDMSAAKKKKRTQYVYVRHAPQTGYMRHPWMDPSFGADGRPYRNPYPPNVCSVDEGYGRFSPCTFRD